MKCHHLVTINDWQFLLSFLALISSSSSLFNFYFDFFLLAILFNLWRTNFSGLNDVFIFLLVVTHKQTHTKKNKNNIIIIREPKCFQTHRACFRIKWFLLRWTPWRHVSVVFCFLFYVVWFLLQRYLFEVFNFFYYKSFFL